MKIVLKVAYEGRAFGGFQRQSESKSVQGALEQALGQILGHPVALTAAGRTDVGVHGTGQVVAFQSDAVKSLDKLLHSLNCVSRDPLVATEAVMLDNEDPFHPRYSAKSRTYSYFILDGCGPRESRFWGERAWCLPQTLDLARANQAALVFLGENDFSTFSFRMQSMETRVRRVSAIGVTAQEAAPLLSPDKGPRLLHLSITANGFLRRMVRLITAAVVEAAMGLRTPEEIQGMLDLSDPAGAPHPAPAAGLYLERITYDPDPFLAYSGTARHATANLRPNHRFKTSTISP